MKQLFVVCLLVCVGVGAAAAAPATTAAAVRHIAIDHSPPPVTRVEISTTSPTPSFVPPPEVKACVGCPLNLQANCVACPPPNQTVRLKLIDIPL